MGLSFGVWGVEYYVRRNGSTPATEWIEAQDNSIKPSIYARIQMLVTHGLLLAQNQILKPMRERPGGKIVPDYYELRHVGTKWRLATYHDRNRNTFVLMCGWRKVRAIQESDVQRALTLLKEYLSVEGGMG